MSIIWLSSPKIITFFRLLLNICLISQYEKNWPRLSCIWNHKSHNSLFPILYIQVYVYKVHVLKKTIDWWYIFNRKWCVKEKHNWRIAVKKYFFYWTNANLGILKDTGKTLITNYMYNIPVIEIVFFSFDYDMLHQAF